MWELYCTLETGSAFSISLGPDDLAEFGSAMLKDPAAFACRAVEAMALVNVEDASAGSEVDRMMILEASRATSRGIDGINASAVTKLRDWTIDQARVVLKSHTSYERNERAIALGFWPREGVLTTREAVQAGWAVALLLEELGRWGEADGVWERVAFGQMELDGAMADKTLCARAKCAYCLSRRSGGNAEFSKSPWARCLYPDGVTFDGSGGRVRSDAAPTPEKKLRVYDELTAVYKLQLATTGPDHLSTLTTATYLAALHRNCAHTDTRHSGGYGMDEEADLWTAKELYEQALVRFTEQLGAEAKQTLAVRAGLAVTMVALAGCGPKLEGPKPDDYCCQHCGKEINGDYVEVEDVVQVHLECVDPWEEARERSKQEYRDAQLPLACVELKMVNEAQQNALGPRHPQTLESLYELACALDGMGETAQATRLMKEVAAVAAVVLGSDDAGTGEGSELVYNTRRRLRAGTGWATSFR